MSHKIWIVFVLSLSGLVSSLTENQTCFIELQVNSTKVHQRWALLIDHHDRCNCTKIIPKPSIYLQPFKTGECGVYPPERYWFTDKPGILVDRSVWNTEKLKYLLGCPYTDVDECIPNMCQNGATCMDELFAYTCLCVDGYEGIDCQLDIDECSSDPCQNGGHCADNINRYTCSCSPGYAGTNCELDIDECSSDPCQNEGLCADNINGYTCSCSPGYAGTHCELDIDECSPNPCQNGGQCTDGIDGYTCTCIAGYEGADCEIDIDECSSNPCQNGGLCTNGINEYTCSCSTGYEGVHCEIPICSQECANDGTCSAPDTCSCAKCYVGATCQSVFSGSPGPLGLEDRTIKDHQMSASSAYADLKAHQGRLNNVGIMWASGGGANPWLQVDFLGPVVITGIQTQGAGRTAQWVTSAQVQYGKDINALQTILANGSPKTFAANVNRNDIKQIDFPESYVARFLRVVVIEKQWIPAMRMEVLGYTCP